MIIIILCFFASTFSFGAPSCCSEVLDQRAKLRAKSRELLEEAQALGDQAAVRRYEARRGAIWLRRGAI